MRRTVLIIHLLIILGLNGFAQAKVEIDCPPVISAGKFSKITVHLSFGNSDGFAKFTQDFPEGFVAEKDELPSGDFNWHESQLSVVWMDIPGNGDITFTYLLKPEPGMNGPFELNGKLTRIEEGAKKLTASADVRTVNIVPGTDIPDKYDKPVPSKNVTNVTKPDQPKPEATSPIKYYRVQVATSSKKLSAEELKKKLGTGFSEKLSIVKTGSVYKYQLGEFRDKPSASRYQKELISKGVKDAFVVQAQ